MIQSNKNGILVDLDDQKQLEDAMRRILSDPSLAARMSENAVKLNGVLDKSVIAEQWRSYILSFCSDLSQFDCSRE